MVPALLTEKPNSLELNCICICQKSEPLSVVYKAHNLWHSVTAA